MFILLFKFYIQVRKLVIGIPNRCFYCWLVPENIFGPHTACFVILPVLINFMPCYISFLSFFILMFCKIRRSSLSKRNGLLSINDCVIFFIFFIGFLMIISTTIIITF